MTEMLSGVEGCGGFTGSHTCARMKRDIGNAPQPFTLLCTCSYWLSLRAAWSDPS
jgi:hypothetical protein